MPTDLPPFDWHQVLLVYGPLGVMAAVPMYFVIRYGTRLIESHLKVMEAVEIASDRQSRALETMSDTVRMHEQTCQKLPKAIIHLAEAGKEAVDIQEVHRHLDRVIDALH